MHQVLRLPVKNNGIFSLTCKRKSITRRRDANLCGIAPSGKALTSGNDKDEAITMELSQHKFAWVLPMLITLALIEALILRFKLQQSYDWRESMASIGVAIGQKLSGALSALVLGGVYLFAWQNRLTTIEINDWLRAALLFFSVEFVYYWNHRISHECRWFWASHAVHHSPQQLNFSAAYRLGWTAGLSGSGLIFIPLVLLGFHPLAVFGMLAINLFYQFWLHNDWMPKFGFIEWIFNTPSHHRVHHAINPEYLDRNYGGILIIYDRLFGSFVAEREDNLPIYGLVKQVNSYNPIKIAFHEWVNIVHDLRYARSLREVMGYLFAAPGWSPDGSRMTSKMLRHRAQHNALITTVSVQP
jgi:sterol desaturase/sphingolipid hydroxylase (fatty acid hydroxylase superfamily)